MCRRGGDSLGKGQEEEVKVVQAVGTVGHRLR